MANKIEYAVIETRKRERLVSVSITYPAVTSLADLHIESDGTEVYQSIVPVRNGKRIDGGKWPL